jgi:hypothetical protein
MPGTSPVPVDLSLLRGFSYACRPDCGLCCYAEPLVSSAEKAGLLRIVPEAQFVTRGRFGFLRSHENGGACSLLTAHRCRAHSARPSPCREFPLTTHVGLRVQATLVLSCPGVDLSSLQGYSSSETAGPPRGFESELAALVARADGSGRRLLVESARRRRRIERALGAEGRWQDEAEVRRRLREAIPFPSEEDFPAEDPPARQDGLTALPLFFDGRAGPVALSGEAGGWELVELRATGGVRTSLGISPSPSHRPPMTEAAQSVLAGYLRYWLERDLLFGVVHLSMLEDPRGSVADRTIAELRRIGATVLSRAQVLSTVRRGEPGELTGTDVQEGLRATDQDLLDRPTWGTRL